VPSLVLKPDLELSHDHRSDALGVLCCGALAFVFSSLAHEAIGHGGAALLAREKITLLTSVFFNASDAQPITDAAGPIMNFLVAGFCILLRSRNRPKSPHGKLLVTALAAVNLFWGFGYFLYCGITEKGDWAFLLRNPDSAKIWRSLLIIGGVIGYIRSTSIVRRLLLPFIEFSNAGTPTRGVLRVPLLLYLSAGGTACFAALFYRGAVGSALHESALETFIGFVGLASIALRTMPRGSASSVIIPRDPRWIAGTATIVLVFAGWMGRGYIS
jgi:hypothetical protein